MKVTRQIDATHFEIELDEADLNTEYQSMIVAHDYVRFFSNEGLSTVSGLTVRDCPAKSCENWIKAQHSVTIGIRTLIDVVLPLLQKNEYIKPEHLLNPDGTPNYTWHEEGLEYTDPETKAHMIAIPNVPERGKWYHIPFLLYYKLKNS